ncbi:unnamed protein product [Euphydryas editha]|uniref:Dihydroxyacetone phosphate acyltransferase n=1 Tax=Euphydryas editha TaxID=104508 RepID=A0AAU9U6F6_EUPED|nr:unnamed protein product [Euphydryas editha]
MAVVGQSMRETGAFYIRRTLAGSPLYAATLRRYVRALVAHYSAPVEFFLEGTRSRSNKSLPPKYGMLSMTLMPYFAREVTDITVVPVNISYDRLIEQGLFAYEHLGVPKPKETTGGLLKALHRLNDHFGNIYINLGDPVSIREFIGGSQTSSEMLKPLDLQELTADEFRSVQDVGDYIVTRQQECTVVTISNLISIVLMESLMNNEVLSFEQVVEKIDWLIQVLRNLRASVFENDVKGSIERILVVHKSLMKLDENNRLRLVSSALMNVNSDVQKKMKGHILKAETMVNAIPIIQLQLYANPVLHYLVPPALIYVIVNRGVTNKEKLFEDYYKIRKMLRHEFFHLEKTEKVKFNEALQFCLRNGVVMLSSDSSGVVTSPYDSSGVVTSPYDCSGVVSSLYERGENVALCSLLQNAMVPALRTLLTCVEVMTQRNKCAHNEVLKLVQERAERARRHAYCLSLEAAANCVRGLRRAGALAARDSEQEVIYESVPDILEECRRLIASVLPETNFDFGNSNIVIFNQDLKAKL